MDAKHKAAKGGAAAAASVVAPKRKPAAAASSSSSAAAAAGANGKMDDGDASASSSGAGGSSSGVASLKFEEPKHTPYDPSAKRRTMPAPDKDTLRILVTTDNHLGYNETDPIRGDDSFRAFDEAMQIARDNQGGDLFHDNKPSRKSFYRCVSILRKYVLGDRPVNFEVVSDQSINFPDTGIVNYEDPNYNIALPVFAIHGNHDDPAGVGSYSSMDLLNSCSLLNYFGKAERIDDIENYPILLRKGTTKVALYGLGNIRDERLHRTFKANKVKWIKPEPGPDEKSDDWFYLSVIHQNRVRHTQHEKNFISESMLPKFLDLVIWGHEHECLIEPQPVEEGAFSVSQPGSSAVTSLSPGEAVEKKVGILEIHNDQFRMIPITLTSLRPFVMKDIKLADHLDPEESSPAEIDKILADAVNEMLTKLAANQEAPPVPLKAEEKSARLPLIRLRVDHTGFPKLSVQRFGQPFVGKVANADEILSFHKQKKITVRKSGGAAAGKEAEGEDGSDFLTKGTDVDEAPPIHDLVQSILEKESPLTVLSMGQMTEAVREYVDKHEPNALENFLTDYLKKMQLDLKKDDALVNRSDIENVIKAKLDRQMAIERKDADAKRPEPKRSGAAGGDVKDVMDIDANDLKTARVIKEDADAAASPSSSSSSAAGRARISVAAAAPARGRGSRGGRGARAGASKAGAGRGKKKNSDDDDDDDGDTKPKRKRAPAGKGKGKRGKKAAAAAAGSDDDDIDVAAAARNPSSEDSDDVSDDGGAATAPKPKTKKKIDSESEEIDDPIPAKSRGAAKKPAASAASDFGLSDDDVQVLDERPSQSSASGGTAAAGGGGRASAKRKPATAAVAATLKRPRTGASAAASAAAEPYSELVDDDVADAKSDWGESKPKPRSTAAAKKK